MKKFLIINPFGIGDVLFTTPVVRAIKQSFPGNIVAYWCNERIHGLLKNNPRIDKLFPLSRGDLKKIYRKSRIRGICKFLNLAHKIKKESFDISLDVSLDHRYSLISKLSNIKRRIGFNYKNRGLFLTDKIDISGYQDRHVVEYYLDLLKLLNIKNEDKRLELFVPEEDKIFADDLLKSEGISSKDLVIGIAAGAGASWGNDAEFKHWPALKFAQLADKIINDLGAKIVILGDKSDRPVSDIILRSMKNMPVDLTGRTTLEELIAVMNNLTMLITNDGGPLHIAVALNKKTVSFFGPVDPAVYGPYPPDENNHIVLRKNLDCAPCYKNFRLNTCIKNKECLSAIDIKEAQEAVERLL